MIKVNFQEQKHKKELEAKEQQCTSLNTTFELSNIITNGELATKELQEVKDWLSAKSGFPNSEYSSQLMNVETEYKAFIIAFNGIKDIDDKTLSKDFTRTGNTFKLSKQFLKELEDSNTIFLAPKLEPTCKKLEDIVVLLNEVEKMQKTSSNYLARDYNGEWSVAIRQLHQLNSRF